MYTKSNYAFINLGCNANQADAERIASVLELKGAKKVEVQEADTLVIMTCAFTTERREESLRQIEQFSTDVKGRVVVSGCLPDINPASLQRFKGLEIIRPRDLDKLKEFTDRTLGTHVRQEEFRRIRVSRGCLGRCTFCAIPKATGPLASRHPEDILGDIENLLRLGYRRIMLSGEDVGAYGREIGTSLGALLESVLRLDGEFELRIESVNPHWLTLLLKEGKTALSDPRLSRHWYVPVQAASNRLLKVMQRPYTVDEFCQSVECLRKLIPDLFLVTDLLVGHPGEKIEDVLLASMLIEQIRVDYLEIMRFDSHQGLVAASLPGVIPEEEKASRVAYLTLLFVRDLLRRRPGAGLRQMGLLPINTNIKVGEIFNAFSVALTDTSPLEDTTESIRGLMAQEVHLSASSHSAPPDRFIAEVCRRIGPPGPVNMPLGSS